MRKKTKKLSADEKEKIMNEKSQEIQSILGNYSSSGEWICNEELVRERTSDIKRKFRKYSDIQKAMENIWISMEGYDDVEENIDSIIKLRNQINKIKGTPLINKKNEEYRSEIYNEIRDAIEQGYAGELTKKAIEYVEEIDADEWGLETIPDFIKDEIESPSENLKKVTLWSNNLKEIKDIDIEVPLDLSYNPIKTINVGKGDFLNILKYTNMDSLGFNKHFAELSKLCEELVDEKINIASEDYDYESLQEWEKNAKKLPQNVIENIFNNDRCKYVYEAGKMNDKDIKVAVFDLIHEKDAEKQREKAKIVKLAVKNEHIALINIIAEKNPNNEEIKKIHDALDKDSTVKLSSFNILL